ncbi:MAG TPA: type II toxin-antitoxin system VapC family toxin [Firmicutes bacterium]|nr:type II toxin-antitoxin system VapC family toxin [Bacillota bacterium]HHY97155.1 type II toxin-antitoxin system VapC family toxin [Bacillota bacterium]
MNAPVFIDTNVPMYAAGRPHPCRKAARDTVRRIVEGDIEAWTDTEVFQEILYRYFAIGEKTKGFSIFDSFMIIMKGRVLPVTEADMVLARRLADSFDTLSPRDLVHLAVMKNHSITRIITADAGFDTVGWVHRLDLLAE